jgi:hypothetical protein
MLESWLRVYSNSSFLLSASGITLSCPSLWINSTSSNAKVLCCLNYFVKALGWVSKYFKEMFIYKDLGLVRPQVIKVTRSHTTLSHELAIAIMST